MKFFYDVEHLPERKPSRKESEELVALKAFLATTQKNMLIEYEEEKAAKSRYGALRKFRSDNKLQEVFELYRRDNIICIVKTKRAAVKRG